MPDYRRNQVPGGTHFFTVNLLDRRSNLFVTNIAALRDAVRRVRARAPFHIDALFASRPWEFNPRVAWWVRIDTRR